jgi:hypothetical protein
MLWKGHSRLKFAGRGYLHKTASQRKRPKSRGDKVDFAYWINENNLQDFTDSDLRMNVDRTEKIDVTDSLSRMSLAMAL